MSEYEASAGALHVLRVRVDENERSRDRARRDNLAALRHFALHAAVESTPRTSAEALVAGVLDRIRWLYRDPDSATAGAYDTTGADRVDPATGTFFHTVVRRFVEMLRTVESCRLGVHLDMVEQMLRKQLPPNARRDAFRRLVQDDPALLSIAPRDASAHADGDLFDREVALVEQMRLTDNVADFDRLLDDLHALAAECHARHGAPRTTLLADADKATDTRTTWAAVMAAVLGAAGTAAAGGWQYVRRLVSYAPRALGTLAVRLASWSGLAMLSVGSVLYSLRNAVLVCLPLLAVGDEVPAGQEPLFADDMSVTDFMNLHLFSRDPPSAVRTHEAYLKEAVGDVSPSFCYAIQGMLRAVMPYVVSAKTVANMVQEIHAGTGLAVGALQSGVADAGALADALVHGVPTDAAPFTEQVHALFSSPEARALFEQDVGVSVEQARSDQLYRWMSRANEAAGNPDSSQATVATARMVAALLGAVFVLGLTGYLAARRRTVLRADTAFGTYNPVRLFGDAAVRRLLGVLRGDRTRAGADGTREYLVVPTEQLVEGRDEPLLFVLRQRATAADSKPFENTLVPFAMLGEAGLQRPVADYTRVYRGLLSRARVATDAAGGTPHVVHYDVYGVGGGAA